MQPRAFIIEYNQDSKVGLVVVIAENREDALQIVLQKYETVYILDEVEVLGMIE